MNKKKTGETGEMERILSVAQCSLRIKKMELATVIKKLVGKEKIIHGKHRDAQRDWRDRENTQRCSVVCDKKV